MARIAAILVCSALLLAACGLHAQSPAPAGRFDYYLLALSWSPAYCGRHGGEPAAAEECALRRGFVVHGLWPQNQDGSWPAFCRPVAPVPVALAARESAIMPNVELIAHEWTKHGSCTVLSADDYFAAIEREFAALRLPPALLRPEARQTLPLAAAKQQWSALNPGLGADMMSFRCGQGAADRAEVQEVRLCLDKSLAFRACGAGEADACPDTISFAPLPPAAGGDGN